MNAPSDTLDAARAQRLDRRRVFIFPSRPGFTLGVMLVIILLGAINYDNALGYLLSFLLAGLVAVAMLHTYRNLAGLRFVGARGAAVFVGETAAFECLIENNSPRVRPALILKHWPRAQNRQQRRYRRRFERHFSLSAGEIGGATVALDADRRGWLRLQRVCLHSHYPLGILRAWAYFESDACCLVYPRPHGRLPLPAANAAHSGSVAPSAGGADEFAGLKPYRPGDPVRAIAWKTLAKEQALMIKRFHGQTAQQFWLDWAATGALGNTEVRLSQLAKWVLDAHAAGASYGLELPGIRIELGQGPQHREQCLRALALFEKPT